MVKFSESSLMNEYIHKLYRYYFEYYKIIKQIKHKNSVNIIDLGFNLFLFIKIICTSNLKHTFSDVSNLRFFGHSAPNNL